MTKLKNIQDGVGVLPFMRLKKRGLWLFGVGGCRGLLGVGGDIGGWMVVPWWCWRWLTGASSKQPQQCRCRDNR